MRVARNNSEIAAVPRRFGESVLDRIGNTPLLRLEHIGADLPGIQLLGKAEWFNPGGSVKDRAAANIIRTALEAGHLTPDKTLLDSTSGNTGIAYAMICAALGIPVTLCMPASVSPERKRILTTYGVNIVYTEAGEGSDGAIRKVREMYAADPEKYFYADQYSNPANWRAHYQGTAQEIWRQTEGHVTHFVAVLGTSGTFVGSSRRLKELNPDIYCLSLQPDSPFHGIEGAKHMPTAIVPSIYDPAIADEDWGISTEDAYRMAKRLAREEGLLVGVSSAAAMVGALKLAAKLVMRRQQATIVCVLPESAEKYLSQRFWDEVEERPQGETAGH